MRFPMGRRGAGGMGFPMGGGTLRRSGRGGRGGGKGRILIALVLAAVAFGTYFFSGQENPITGEVQRVGLNPDQEVALGYRAMPQMIREMGGAVPESHHAARLVSDVGRRLLEANPRLASGPYEFTFTLLADDQTVNAFALPGGPCFITVALLSRLEDEAQLAGVLGHEIGHVVHRHGAERMAKGQLFQGLSGAVVVGSSESVNQAQVAAVAAGMVSNVMLNSYGRKDELESDRYGLEYMRNAGYDPSAMLDVMAVLRDATGTSGRNVPEFMMTHPHPESRIEAIRAYLAETFPNGVPGTLTRGRRLR